MKKSKFDIVYESIKEDLKKRLFMEDAETEQEDPALEDDMAAEEEDQETEDMTTEEDEFSDDEIDEEDEFSDDEIDEDEEESEDPELVKEFLDNMQINAQGAASGNTVDNRGAASGNDIKIPAM